MEAIKVIIVDDEILIAQSLKTVLELQTNDIIVLGVAYGGAYAIELVNNKKPDVILMDIRMPNMDGIEATKVIHKSNPDIKIIMLTTFNDDDLVYNAIKSGASGYLLKDISTDMLIASIIAVKHDVILISPEVAANLVNEIKGKQNFGGKNVNIDKMPEWYGWLTEKEKKIIQLVEKGYTNQEIADKFFLAEQTIKNYISVIYSKIGVSNRKELRQLLINFRSIL